MRTLKIFIICLFAFLLILDGNACTMVLVSGKATSDGRPLMFKIRDSDDGLGVEMRIVETECFTYLGQYASSAAKSTAWGGFNEKGFAIANSLSYNVPAPAATQNSLVIRNGLTFCETLQDFEIMLDSMLVDTLMVRANYAVMDAQGNAAFYEMWETGYMKYDVNDPEVAPYGVLVRTNYCLCGTSSGRSGTDRYRIATSYMQRFQDTTIGWKDLLPLSRLLVNQNGVDLLDSAPMGYYDETLVELSGYVARYNNTNAMIIQGVKSGESPLLTMCWATVGFPLTTVVAPFCLTSDRELPAKAVSDGDKKAWLCEKGETMKGKLFPYSDSKAVMDLAKLYNQEETGILQTVLRLEEEVVRKGEILFDGAREAGEMSPSALHEYYEWLDPYLENEYVNAFGWDPIKEGFLMLSEDETNVTFYYDLINDSCAGKVYALDYGGLASKTAKKVNSVSFDPSFADARPKTTRGWFKNMSNIVSIDGMEYLNMSKVSNMSSMFEGCSSLDSLDMSNFNTSSVKNMSALFKGCSSLTNLDVTPLNTTDVTNMSEMFKGCSSLENLDVTHFNTSNVTNMKSMFEGCTSMANFDVGYFNTSKVTDMSALFKGCTRLTNLDVTPLNTTAVTNMSEMFKGCSGLDSLDVTLFNTSNVTNMKSMFEGCTSMTNFDVANFNTSKVTDMSAMFKDCSGLKYLDLANFDTSQAANTQLMLSGCIGLDSLVVGGMMGNLADNACEGVGTEEAPSFVSAPKGFDYGVYTYGNFLWKGGWVTIGKGEMKTYIAVSEDETLMAFYDDNLADTRLGTIIFIGDDNHGDAGTGNDDAGTGDGEGLGDDAGTGDVDVNEKDSLWCAWHVDEQKVRKVVFDPSFANARPLSCHGWFEGFCVLEEIEGMEYLNTTEVTDMRSMFAGCCNLKDIDLSHFDTSNVNNMEYLFLDCSSLETLDLSGFHIENAVGNGDATPDDGGSGDVTPDDGGSSDVTPDDGGSGDVTPDDGGSGDVTPDDGSFGDVTPDDGGSGDVTPDDGSSGDVTPDNGSSGDEGPGNEGVDGGVDSENEGLLYGTKGLLSGCIGLRHLVLSSSMSRLFDGDDAGGVPACNGVGTDSIPCLLTVSYDFDFGFDTDSLSRFQWKGGWFTLGEGDKKSYLILSDDCLNVLFYHDEKKQGRKGIVIDLEDYEGLPAHSEDVKTVIFTPSFIDARPTSTRSWFEGMSALDSIAGLEYLNTSEVKDMSMMFYGCSSLKSLELASFETSNVSDMGWMFCYCDSLAELDVTHFNTSNVTRMTAMFFNDACLTNLDVSHFDTSNVKDMSMMFYGCSSLDSLDVTSFNTSKVTTMEHMFSFCSALSSLDVSGFNTSKVKNMRQMFNACYGLMTLDLSNFDISKTAITAMMLDNCRSLECLTLSDSMGDLDDNACSGVGSEKTPSLVIAPEGFDFGVDTIGNFQWKSGWFALDRADSCVFEAKALALLPGSTSMLQLSLNNGHEHVNAFQMDITLTGGVSLVEDGESFAYTLGERCDGMEVKIVEDIEGHYSLMAFFMDEKKAIKGPSGPVITLAVKADVDAVQGTRECWVENIVLSNLDFDVIKVAPLVVPVDISGYPLGDVNHDGDVNVSDVMMTVSVVLGQPVDNFHEENANVNGDDQLNISDIMCIVDIVLHHFVTD